MKRGTSEVGACSAMVSMFFYRNVRNERNDVGRTKLASRAALEARPGEAVYFFAQVYSPARFSDVLTLHWFFHDPRQGWVSSDRIPLKIVGGRKEGFRGYSFKKNYSPGDWRVKVETTDGREIGRIRFRLRTSLQSPDPTRFKTEIR